MNKLKINTQMCKACGYCVKFCPKEVLEVGEDVNNQGYPYVVEAKPALCIACGICATVCPDGVIEVYKEDK